MFGISSIKFSIDGNYSLAVIFILIAAILDALDGRIATINKRHLRIWKRARLSHRFCKFWNSACVYIIFLGIE